MAKERQFRQKVPADGQVLVVTVDTEKPQRFEMLGVPGRAVLNAGYGARWRSWHDKPKLQLGSLCRLQGLVPYAGMPSSLRAW